jgi:hypothetical protein
VNVLYDYAESFFENQDKNPTSSSSCTMSYLSNFGILTAIPFEVLENNVIFAVETFQTSKIMEVAINNNIYQQAQAYARQQGLSLNAVIEGFLVRFIGRSQAATEQKVPDIVLSLLGAGDPVSDDDLNAREAYYQFLDEKYK